MGIKAFLKKAFSDIFGLGAISKVVLKKTSLV